MRQKQPVMLTQDPFQHNHYLLKRHTFRILGAAFDVLNSGGEKVFYGDLKRFRLKEDVTIFAGDHTTPLLSIKARSILDFSAAYDVVDVRTQEKVGVLRRKGMASTFVRDTWEILDAMDNPVGEIQEDSVVLAQVRRWLTELVPQTYHATLRGSKVMEMRQRFNPFVLNMDIDFTMDINHLLDRRLGIAATVIVAAIEGRQG